MNKFFEIIAELNKSLKESKIQECMDYLVRLQAMMKDMAITKEQVQEYINNVVMIYRNDLIRKFNSILESYAKKRRGEEIVESFDQLGVQFQECIKEIIKDSTINLDIAEAKAKPFAAELFEKYTNVIQEGDKTKIEAKEAVSDVFDYAYFKQWSKPKFTEGKTLDEFIISGPGVDIYIEKDIFAEGFESANLYFKRPKNIFSRVVEAVEFLQPRGSDLNQTEVPAWIKRLSSGKVSMRESSPLERTMEFTRENASLNFLVSRESENCDFWRIEKIK